MSKLVKVDIEDSVVFVPCGFVTTRCHDITHIEKPIYQIGEKEK